jgi:hypothetical protein
MPPEQAMERINQLLAHAWMVRAFLKHADEVQEDVEMLEVHRMIFDYCRAVEPSYQRRDAQEYLHRARGKLPKLRRQAEFFAENFRRISDHTNFQMAALSLRGVVDEIDAVLSQLVKGAAK